MIRRLRPVRVLAVCGGVDVSDAEAPSYWRLLGAQMVLGVLEEES